MKTRESEREGERERERERGRERERERSRVKEKKHARERKISHMREKKNALKSVCETYENPQKIENSMKTNRIRTALLKIITRSHFLKPRQSECITRNTIWDLLLPTGCSYFFAD